MPDDTIHDRRFSDEEVAEILKRAVQARPSRALVKGEGISLDELKAIGEEVGIDPMRMEDAARSLTVRQANRPNLLLGSPTVLHVERRVEGSLRPDDTPDVLAVIRRVMETPGSADEVHGAIEWTAAGESGTRHLMVSSREGVTTIRGSANLKNLAVASFLPAGAVGVVMTIMGSALWVKDANIVGLVMALTILPILYPIMRSILGRYSRSESEKLDRVVDEVARLASGPSE